MKKILLFAFAFIAVSNNYGQESPEIITSNKNMSLGNFKGYHLELPSQSLKNALKIYKKEMKELKAKDVDAPKQSNEIIYENVYAQGIKEPMKVHAVIEQEGKNVGYTGYFFDQNNQPVEKDEVKNILKNIYKKSMFTIYEDSIVLQEKALAQAEKQLEKMNKDAIDKGKNVNKNTTAISESENAIALSESNITALTDRVASLTLQQTEAQGLLNQAKSLQSGVDIMEDDLKSLTKKHKSMTKNLADLEKDPATNANLILATREDLKNLSAKIKDSETAYKARKEEVSKQIKTADKNYCDITSQLKSTKKSLDKENKTIQKSKDKIVESKSEIEANNKDLESFQTAEKQKQEEIIKLEKEKLEALKKAQSQYN